jgi:hypothetical protein
VSGDVSKYSIAIGGGLADRDLGVRLAEGLQQEYESFAGRNSPTDVAALALIFSELAIYREKMHIKYYASLAQDIYANQEAYLQQATEKIVSARQLLGDFEFIARDAVVTLADVGAGDVVFYDPPFWIDGYGKMFEAFDKCFTMPAVNFIPITEELKSQALCELHNKGAIVFYRPEDEVEINGYAKVFEYLYKANGRRYYVYSNSQVQCAQGWAVTFREEQQQYDVLFEDAELPLKADVKLVPLGTNAANHYRMMWTKKVSPRAAEASWGLCIDGKLAGIIGIKSGVWFGSSYAAIFSDAVPLYTRYKRLAKVVLYVICSQEFLDLVNEKFLWTYEGFTTIVYSDEPVSMKYRGVFDLAERKTTKEGDPSSHKYALVYRAQGGKYQTVKEAYRAWHGKHSKSQA